MGKMRTWLSAALVAFGAFFGPIPAGAALVGAGTATIIQPVSINTNASLRFGTLIRPTVGSATAIISNTGVLSGTAGSVASSAHGNADFTVLGEGGQSVTIAVDPSFTMNGPSASTLVVTTTATNTGIQTLPGTIGSPSSGIDVAVGGSITIPNTQTTGAYAGTFSVTASYN